MGRALRGRGDKGGGFPLTNHLPGHSRRGGLLPGTNRKPPSALSTYSKLSGLRSFKPAQADFCHSQVLRFPYPTNLSLLPPRNITTYTTTTTTTTMPPSLSKTTSLSAVSGAGSKKRKLGSTGVDGDSGPKKYYAVRTGRVPGVYTDWDMCKAHTFGFKGASCKLVFAKIFWSTVLPLHSIITSLNSACDSQEGARNNIG